MKRFVLLCLLAAVCAVAVSSTASASPVSRANAVRTAHDYLSSQGFSYQSLVDQLQYEGYSRVDSAYAAGHSGANWYKQATRVARDYLNSQGFSRSGLIGQLEYEGFTVAQAVYGARTVGL